MTLTEIRIFSRGGQGGVTSGKLLALAAALEGYEVQAIPKYGSERKGAPLFTDVRIASKNHPIRTHSPVGNLADHFLVLEPSLLNKLPQDMKEEAIIIANAKEIPKTVSSSINRQIGKVDAYSIANQTGLVKSGTHLVSTIMLGAWCKATNELVSLVSIKNAVNKNFKKELAKNNINAIQIAYDQFESITLKISH